ncbi:hypothetical protein SCARR_02475 [Pontiella sulfatireligans]|uniref:Uncharacterized protein n=1 Tax=Pontiella sulfatireligans TaxID=2750658 RepID=A0A6C2UJK8_9BACT|nr:hypothetical protein SCARR_02475 [Pontiella sulfatireligans]
MENPYWQSFGGNQYFEHKRPIEHDELLPETIPRLKSKSPVDELFNSIKGGPAVGSNFDYE